jgi:hypothetical protein
MYHNLAIESLNYYNNVQTHSSTHTNVLKSTKIKFYTYYMASLNSNRHRSDRCGAPIRPVQHKQQPRQRKFVSLILNILPL